MKYCPNCGKPVDPKAVICPNCGVALTSNIPTSSDNGSIGWFILGFFIPIVGLVLYIVWKNDEPKNAHKAGLGALISVCVSVGFFILTMLFAMIAGFASA